MWGVSSQLRHEATGFDEIIEVSHGDYAGSGLKTASLIRLGFITALPASQFAGSIGAISRERHRRLLQKLCGHLGSDRSA